MDFQKLRSDRQAIEDKSQVTVADLAAVRNDFSKIESESTSQPDATKLQTLTNDINALTGQLPTAAQATQIQADYTAVLQSQGITDQTLINQTVADINTVVQASGLTSADVTTIAADRKAIQTDMANNSNASSGSTSTPSGHPFPFGPRGGGFGGGRMGGRLGGFGMAWGNP
jgi:hypothetical protein